MILLGRGLLFVAENGLMLYAAHAWACALNRKPGAVADTLLATGVIYFSQITFTVLLLGIFAPWLTLRNLVIVNTILSLAMAAAWGRQRRPILSELAGSWQRLAPGLDRAGKILLALFALFAGLLLLKVVLFPPHVWDVLTYHLTPAVEWYQQARIPAVIPTQVDRMNSEALGLTVLSFWNFIFFRDDFLVALPQLQWALLLVPAVISLARRSGIGRGLAVKAAVAVFFIPSILIQAWTVKDHVALTASFILALVFMGNYLATRERGQLLLTGLSLGLMLGYKLVGVAYFGCAWLVWFYFARVNPVPSQTAGRWARRCMDFSCVILPAVLLGGYWYLRNFILYGRLQGSHHHPLFEVLQGSVWESLLFRLGVFTRNLVQFVPRILDYRHEFEANLTGISGFGPQFFALGLPAMVLSLASLALPRERRNPVHFPVYTAWLLLIFYFFLYYTLHNYRLFMFFPALLILYSAYWFQRSGAGSTRTGRAILNGVLLAAVLWSGLMTLIPAGQTLSGLRGFLRLDRGEQTVANFWRLSPRATPYAWISDYLPASEPLAVLTDEDSWSYIYYDRNWRRKLRFFNRGRDMNQALQRPVPVGRLKRFLRIQGVPFACLCDNSLCYAPADPDLLKIYQGLYYYAGGADVRSRP